MAGEPGSSFGDSEPPPRSGVPFAGRQSQLAHLAAEYERVRDGATRLTLIHGEAGVGKTRLVSEFLLRIEPTGPAILLGRCDQEGLIPYQAIVEALRDHLSSEGGDATLANLGPEWAELRRLLPGEANPRDEFAATQLSPATRRYQLFESVVTLLSVASRGRPLVLVLEDLHWSDQPLLMLLRHLLRTRRLRGVHVLATYRESDLDAGHALHAFLAETGHDDAGTAIALGGLSKAEVGELFDALVQGEPTPGRDRYLRLVFERTDGNPFFALQMFRHASDTGLELTHDSDSGVPGGVQELVMARMRNLPAPVREVLGVAGVIGHHFDFTLLQRVTGIGAGELLDLLDAAVRAGHVIESPGAPGQFQFVQAISRDAVYATLPPGQRASIHHRIGSALEALGPARTTAVPEQLAYHFERSSETADADRAVRYARIAGERALHAFAFEDAVGFFEAALRAQERMQAPSLLERCELLLNLGRAQAGVEGPVAGTAHDRDQTIATFTTAANLARELGSPQLMVRAAVDCTVHWLEGTGSYGTIELDLLHLQEDVLSWLPGGASPERLELLLSLRGLYTAALQPGNRTRCVREIQQVATALGDRDSLTIGELALATELWETDRYREAVHVFDRCVKAANDRPEVLSPALFLRMACVTRLGDSREMRATSARVRQYARHFRDPYLRVWSECLFEGGFAHMAGDLEGALRHNRRALEASAEIGSRQSARNAEVQRFYLRQCLAKWAPIRALWQSWSLNPGPFPRVAVAWSAAQAGHFDVAIPAIERFESGEAEIPGDRLRITFLGHLAEAAALAGRTRLAAKLYEDLLPGEGLVMAGSPAFVLGPIGRPLGMLASLLQRWDAADAHFEAAIATAKRMEHRPAVADTNFEYARSLVARNQWSDRSRARDMAEFAETEAQSMGYRRLELDAAALLEGMGRGGYPAGLSDREVEVVRLVARGLSNREIADELVVSPATVATHVRHIFEKTGTANRAQAVAFAVRHDLT